MTNFNKLRERTKNRAPQFSEFGLSKSRKLLQDTVVMQTQITEQFKGIKKDYKKNQSIYTSLYNEVMLLRSKKDKPKFDDITNPFKRKENSGKGGGILGSIFSALGMAGMILRPLLSKITKSIGKTIKGLTGSLFNLLKKMGGGGKAGKRVAGGGISKALQRGAMGLGATTGRVATATAARFIGAGVVGMAAGAVGYPMLIAAAAAAVGYGTYKLGRYLKLSEKLDDFIKKVSGGKYRDIGDFILGLVDGTVGKDLYGWVKDKISGLFTDAIVYLKDKTNDIFKKWSPFINDPTTQAGGADASNSKTGEGANSGGNTSSGGDEATANDKFREQLSGVAGNSEALGMAQSVNSQSASTTEGGEYSETGPAVDMSGANTAWKAITNGQNTKINSHFGNRKGGVHKGIDIQASIGTPIYAVEDGVISKNVHARGGIQAHLTGNSGTVYGVAHLSKVVKTGKISAGEMYALSGNTGRSTGPHIHFSVRRNGTMINPINFGIPRLKSNTAKTTAKGGTGSGSEDTNPNIAMETGNNKFEYNANTSGVNSDITHTLASAFSSNLTSNYGQSNQSSLGKSTSTLPKKSTLKAPSAAQASANSSSKAGSIEGKTPGMKDPRGALSKEIMLASTSPLFL